MKKIILLLLSLSLSGTCALLSQDIYVKLGGARRIAAPSRQIDINYTSVYIKPISTYGQEGVFGSFGAGNEIDCAIGLTGKTLGIEMGCARVFKSTIDATQRQTGIEETGASINNSAMNTYESSMFTITPCVVMTFPLGFSVRLGGVLGFPTYTRKSHQEKHALSNETSDWAIDYNGPMALGVTGSVGFAFGVAAGLKLYMEADVVSMSWAPTSAEATAYRRNGEDLLATLSVSSRKIIYVDGGPKVDPPLIQSDEPITSLKTYYSYSTVGLKAGIMIGL